MVSKKKTKGKVDKVVEPKTPDGATFCIYGMCWACILALIGGLVVLIGYLSSEGVEVEVPCFDKHNNLIKDVVCSETPLTLDNEISEAGAALVMSGAMLFSLAIMFLIIAGATALDGGK